MLLIIGDGIFTGLFLFGVWLTRKRWKNLLPIYYPYSYTLVTLAPFYLNGRNFVDVYFAVLLLASFAVVRFWERMKPGRAVFPLTGSIKLCIAGN